MTYLWKHSSRKKKKVFIILQVFEDLAWTGQIVLFEKIMYVRAKIADLMKSPMLRAFTHNLRKPDSIYSAPSGDLTLQFAGGFS